MQIFKSDFPVGLATKSLLEFYNLFWAKATFMSAVFRPINGTAMSFKADFFRLLAVLALTNG